MEAEGKGEAAAAATAGVGRLLESGHAEDRRLIALVRARPLLYARSTLPVASYYAQVRSCWQEVAARMGWPVAEARRKWSHVRNSYSRHLRNEAQGARTGRGRAVSRWYLADELHFLRDHMATDVLVPRPPRTPRAPHAPHACATKFLEMNLAEVYAANAGPGARAGDGEECYEAGVKCEPPGEEDYAEGPEEAAAEECAGAGAGAEEVTGPYWQFFRCVYDEYRTLSAQRQRSFRRRCLHVLHQLLDEQELGGAGEGEGEGSSAPPTPSLEPSDDTSPL